MSSPDPSHEPVPTPKDAALSASAEDPSRSGAPAGAGGKFDPKLVEILVCPLTRTTLAYDAARQELVSRAARLAFPIRDGMPVLVREEARDLDDPKSQ